MSPIEHAHYEHDHKHSHDHHHSHWHHDAHLRQMHQASLKTITIAFALNFSFTIIEVIGGYWAGSLAILADAVHDFGDTISLGLALYLYKIAGRGRNEDYSYGYRRFTLLSAILAGVFIVSGSLFVFFHAITRLNDAPVPKAGWMIGLAVLGVIVNGYAALRLSRGHSQGEGILSWHLIEDALGWVVVLIGALFIYWKGWAWIDPALAIVLSVFIIFNVTKSLKKTVEVFLQRKPGHVSVEKISHSILHIEGVTDIHDLHIWSLDGEQNVMSLHVVLKDREVDVVQVKDTIQKIMNQYGAFHTTIETEIEGEVCHVKCN